MVYLWILLFQNLVFTKNKNNFMEKVEYTSEIVSLIQKRRKT